MRTMKEQYFKYYDELPPPIAERAKANYSGCTFAPRSVSGAVNSGFYWSPTREGMDFWSDVCIAADGHGPYPKIPTRP